MFNQTGAELPAIDGVADALAKLAHEDALTRTYARWVLRGAGQAGLDALKQAPQTAATRGALVFLGQIVEERRAEPVPSLGGSVVFDCESDALDGDEDLWLAMVEREQYLELDDPRGGAAWEPDRIVLARTKVTLVSYDWASEDEVECEVTTDGAFTMSALLRAAHATHVRLSNEGGTRIFEGLRRVRDGVYRIETGS